MPDHFPQLWGEHGLCMEAVLEVFISIEPDLFVLTVSYLFGIAQQRPCFVF